MTHETQARIAALVTAGFIAATAAATAGTAYADTVTSGNGSIGGGNQLNADLDVPLNVCGNAIAILGLAGAQCTDSGAAVIEDKSSSVRGPKGGYEGAEEAPGGEAPGEEAPGGGSTEGENPGEEAPEGEDPGQGVPPEVPEDREGLAEESSAPVDEQPAPDPSASPAGPSAEQPGQQSFEQSAEERSEQTFGQPAEQGPGAELAVTGTDSTGLFGLVAAAVAAVAAGAGLVVAGMRRRARS
ncbi:MULTISPECIES: chaplin family protein [Nocardiopsidaceae]|uniref:Chaplin family protein n=1 Tax=Streptomonospora nanhaiensis TaxID=1323731 RepID=A0ABY6YL52_9ACTN|nr:chaplin family protein [Streptomonospora nanhaiensis]WAE73094.1 chaplin family protein [Streptomonospora nanhaiensis]